MVLSLFLKGVDCWVQTIKGMKSMHVKQIQSSSFLPPLMRGGGALTVVLVHTTAPRNTQTFKLTNVIKVIHGSIILIIIIIR